AQLPYPHGYVLRTHLVEFVPVCHRREFLGRDVCHVDRLDHSPLPDLPLRTEVPGEGNSDHRTQVISGNLPILKLESTTIINGIRIITSKENRDASSTDCTRHRGLPVPGAGVVRLRARTARPGR